MIRARKRRSRIIVPEYEGLSVTVPGSAGKPEQEMINRSIVREVEMLTADLPPRQRIVFVLRDLHDLNIKEVTEITGIPAATIHEWHEVHSWDHHVQERIVDLNQAFAEQFHTQTQNVRSKMLLMINASLEQFEKDAQGVPFPITSHADLEMVARVYERLNRANAIALESAKELSTGEDGRQMTWADLLRTTAEHEGRS